MSDSGFSKEEVRPTVLLRSGTASPPLFITHGLGGDIAEVRDLVDQIATTRPVYGLQAKGLDASSPDESIEAMAQYFLDGILEIQTHGPYLLAGLSFGGLVVLEIAQSLKQRGERIALLALLDTYPDARYWPFRSWISVIIRRFFEQAHSVVKLPPGQAISRVKQLSRGLIEHVRRRKGALPQWVKEGQSEQRAPDKVQQLRHACMIAMGRYMPRYYDGKVVFLKSELSTRFPSNPAAIWRNLVGSLEIRRVPGDHLAIITGHVDVAGAHLSSSIDRGLCEKS